MFGINPLELLIVGATALVMVGGPVIAVVIMLRKNSSRPSANLSPCPDCGRLLSRQAITCPQCGRPIEKGGPRCEFTPDES
jgi:predicted amidophosphoribosyltransferase